MSFLHSNSVRRLVFLVGIVGALFAIPLIPLLAMVAIAARHAAWEIFALGLLMDFLWFSGTPVPLMGSWFSSVPLFTLIACVLLWGLEPLRREFLIQ